MAPSYLKAHKEGILTYGEVAGISMPIIQDAFRTKNAVDIPMGEFGMGRGLGSDRNWTTPADLETQKATVSADERLLLDDLLLVLKLFNSRDQDIKLDGEFYKNFYESSEIGMRTFIHKYPHESYIKAEYIEVLHANHGAQTALDSIDALATPQQKILPFYLSYAAFLESELGNYKKALAKATDLQEIINNDQAPAVYYTFAQLYLDMDSLNLAKINVEKAITLDPKHQMAFRVKAKVDKKLTEQNVDSIN